jgi:hypothetical protein
MRRLPLLDRIFVSTPCKQDWEAMPGDQRVRSCESCQLPVHDLSAMTRAEAEALVASHKGRMCARYLRRADGTIATTDEPGPRRRVRWLAVAAAAGVVGLAAEMRIYRELTAEDPVAPTAQIDQVEVIARSSQEHVTDRHVEHEPAPPPPLAARIAEVYEQRTMGVVRLSGAGAFHELVDDLGAGEPSPPDRGTR